MHVHSYSSIGHSESILSEFAASHTEENFTLCYLWHGKMNTSIKDMHQSEQFYGYTMLQLHEHESPKILKGSYLLIEQRPKPAVGFSWSGCRINLKENLSNVCFSKFIFFFFL